MTNLPTATRHGGGAGKHSTSIWKNWLAQTEMVWDFKRLTAMSPNNIGSKIRIVVGPNAAPCLEKTARRRMDRQQQRSALAFMETWGGRGTLGGFKLPAFTAIFNLSRSETELRDSQLDAAAGTGVLGCA